ncbi:Golgi-associated plant pathogenesis-related protein 1-like [Montipora capricornis]|uniref:Golgi-associated plant pathogenesis-related protein 1-like n=1 Tax=Montipora capricornis TaxID=246305 RepID=UPI0035F2138F
MTVVKLQIVLLFQAVLCMALHSDDKNEYQMKKASKKSLQLQTAYVYRTNLPRRHHYSVIMGSSGKTVIGPLVPESGEEQIHRVQGFVLTPDTIKAGDPIEFAGTALNTHNRYRLYHHAQPLKWSDKLSSQANKIAYQMAQQFRKTILKRFGVPDEETVGENVEKFLGVDFSCDSTAAMKATDKWYQQNKNYSYNYPHIQDDTSSFTQLVWKSSRFLGMGCAIRKGLLANDVFVVALYSPPEMLAMEYRLMC